MADKKGKISEISNLLAVFCHNVPNNTHKINNNRHALVIKQKKRISEKCLLVIQK